MKLWRILLYMLPGVGLVLAFFGGLADGDITS